MRAESSVDRRLAARVQAAAAELNYVPNMVARNLRRGGGNIIGCVIGEILDPYFADIAEAVTVRAESKHSMMAIVSNMQRSPELEIKHCRQLWEQRVAGLILAGGGFDQRTHADEFSALIQQITAAGVVVATLSPRTIDVPAFTADNVAVGALMAEHILERRHTEIAVVTGSTSSEATNQRLVGIEGVLRRAGVHARIGHAEHSPQAGFAAARQLLADHPETTAVLATADSMAIGVMSGLAAIGKRVPEDVSVIGVGNTRLAAFSSPSLTTVDVRLSDHAQAATDFIASRVRGVEVDEFSPLPPAVVAGASVGTAPRTH
jgi:LacI family transcriptional regulator